MRVLVSAFEHSANIHLGALLNALQEDIELVGVFSERYGDPLIDMSTVSIMGVVDALKNLRFFFRLRDDMLTLAEDVDKVLLIDSSGFNLPLAKKLRKTYPDLEIIYYILPQAWAWKRGRIPVLERTVSKLCSILPFEPSYYGKNAPIEYVGHPLLDEIVLYKTEPTRNGIVAFMPGSRPGEIKRLMPVFREVRARLDIEARLIVPENFSQEKIADLYGDTTDFDIFHNAHKTLFESDFAFICSGTATLEAALIGVPFILAYKAKALDYAIGSRLVKLPYVGLGNIMFDKMGKKEPLHPEFLQEAVTAQNLLRAYERMDRARFFNDARRLKRYLGGGSSKNMAKILTS